jgi:TonB family protein
LLGMNRQFAITLLLIVAGIVTNAHRAWGEDEIARKVKTKVAPTYPEIARRMNITGVVRLLVTVTPSGSVKDAKVVGGHPVLATSALDAVKKWRYEPSAQEATGIVEFRFDPTQ